MKQHPLYTHLYLSEDGRVYSAKSHKFLKLLVNANGYWVLATKLGGRTGTCKTFRVHRLVAEVYHPNPNNLPQVNHRDGNKLNNHYSNLEWVSAKQNTQHAWDMGLITPISRDERSQAKITEAQLQEIKNSYIPYHKEFGLRSLGRKYNISHPVLSRLVRRGEVESPSSMSGSF